MSRIHVAVSEEEIEMIDELRKQYSDSTGFTVSRQRFVRGFLVENLRDRLGAEKQEIEKVRKYKEATKTG